MSKTKAGGTIKTPQPHIRKVLAPSTYRSINQIYMYRPELKAWDVNQHHHCDSKTCKQMYVTLGFYVLYCHLVDKQGAHSNLHRSILWMLLFIDLVHLYKKKKNTPMVSVDKLLSFDQRWIIAFTLGVGHLRSSWIMTENSQEWGLVMISADLHHHRSKLSPLWTPLAALAFSHLMQ